ncbi:MAG: sigma-54 dependent transcriptional regulator [Rhodanobacter sp.]
MYGSTPSILLVDDDQAFTSSAAEYAMTKGCKVEVASTCEQAERLIEATSFDLLLLDLSLPDGDGLDLLKRMDAAGQGRVVVLTGYPSAKTAARAWEFQILDYMVKPLAGRRFDGLLEQAAAHAASRTCHRGTVQQCGALLTQATVMNLVFNMIRRVAPLQHTVLLHGESGTGKELAARALHQYSGRSGKFVALNCGALAGDMAGSQLFGHERGSFTGAVADHAGVFEQAHRGTLFLDEFSEMPAHIQTYLLRILEGREVTRLGAHACRALDVRVIAASNREPQEAIQSGVLRADLYYRLAEFAIFLPPLRARMADVDLLAQHFVDQINEQQGVSRMLSPESLIRFHAHSWPGNVRELRHVICRANVMAEGAMLDAWPDAPPLPRRLEMDIHPGQTLEDIERRAIMLTLDHFGSDRTRAADALGISVKTIYNKLARYRADDAPNAA